MNLYGKICDKFISIKHFFIVSAIAASAHAQEALNFPAEKNNIQILPQKFEYSLQDSTKLILGNRVIDTSQFSFKIIPSASSVDVELRWPGKVFESTQLRILNPSGVAVWAEEAQNTQDTLTVSNAADILQKLLGLSFFRFCAGHYEINTGMEICTPEMILKGAGPDFKVANRNEVAKPAITINNRPVTPHGIVFLNAPKESLSFRATSASGAEFRMDTRKVDFEFVNVLEVDEKHFILTVKGPTPLAPSRFRKIDNDKWSIALRKDRPLFYVSGDGKVPLRQEFAVSGPLPTKKHRLVIDKNSPKLTYSSSLNIQGLASERGTPQATEGSEVAVSGKRFIWFLKNIPFGQEKQVYLYNRDEEQTFTAAHTVSRQDSSRFELLLGFNSDDTHFYFGGEAQTWFESIPGLQSFTTQRLGLGLLYNQDLSGDAKVILTELDLFYRAKVGLQFWEPTWIAGLAIQNWAFDSETLQTLSPIVGWQGHSPAWAKQFHWQEIDFKYTLPKNTDAFKLKQRFQARWKLYQKTKSETLVRYSLGAFMQEIEADKKSQTSGLLAEGALVWTF